MFVGEAPGKRKGQPGSRGRLERFLGLGPGELNRRPGYMFVNLFDQPQETWPNREACEQAARSVTLRVLQVAKTTDSVSFVLLGRRVAKAFRHLDDYFVVRRSASWPTCRWLGVVVPHPSGRCRLWNDKKTVETFRAVMAEVGAL